MVISNLIISLVPYQKTSSLLRLHVSVRNAVDKKVSCICDIGQSAKDEPKILVIVLVQTSHLIPKLFFEVVKLILSIGNHDVILDTVK